MHLETLISPGPLYVILNKEQRKPLEPPYQLLNRVARGGEINGGTQSRLAPLAEGNKETAPRLCQVGGRETHSCQRLCLHQVPSSAPAQLQGLCTHMSVVFLSPEPPQSGQAGRASGSGE